MKRLSATLRRGHISDERLDELARARVPVATAADPTELHHLSGCRRCRGMIGGFARAETVLGGAWVDRPLHSRPAVQGGADRVRLIPSRSAVFKPRAVIPALGAAIVVALVATAGLLSLRGSAVPAASGASPTGGASAVAVVPAGTRVVARVPVEMNEGVAIWAPDGAHLLVLDGSGSRVFDRAGNVVGTFGPNEGWLDAGHLIDGDGKVWALTDNFVPKTGAYPWYGPVIASGHGAAALVVAQPACEGDPIVAWYHDGRRDNSSQKVTVFGWSPDGTYVLEGHMDCSDQDAMLHGWKGHVDVVDIATGRTVATVPDVRGPMAFNLSGTRLAAQSDTTLEFLDLATGRTTTAADARLLGWGDDDNVYALAASGDVAIVSATSTGARGVVSGGWGLASSAGPSLVADTVGRALRVVGADHSTLLDLSSAGLVVRPDLAGGYQGTFLIRSPWSPDGRMLALAAADGTSIVLISVDPGHPGVVGSALPTPVATAGTVTESSRIALPGAVHQLVADAKRHTLWFLGGVDGQPLHIYRYDVDTGSISDTDVPGITRDEARDRLAIAPDGRLWISAVDRVSVYDPDRSPQQSTGFPIVDPDIQPDPKTGQPNAWIAGIAFDADGNALVARNWVKSLLRLNGSMSELGRVQVSDGFPMTGDVVVAGGRVYVGADPSSGLAFGVDVTGTGKQADVKFVATAMASVGDRVLAVGTPPMWIGADGAGQAMTAPVLDSADLVTGGPGGISALYSAVAGEVQWRDAAGRVSAQAVFPAGKAPQVAAITFDGYGALWAVESADGIYSLVRLSPAK